MKCDDRARAMRAEIKALSTCLEREELVVLAQIVDRLADVAPPAGASPPERVRFAVGQARFMLAIVDSDAEGLLRALAETDKRARTSGQ